MKARVESRYIAGLGGDGKAWPQTMDAVVWAKEFVETATRIPSIATDEGTMIGWFANAIMAGYDEAQRRCHQPPNNKVSDASDAFAAPLGSSVRSTTYKQS
jgi:hypothetical protein